LLRLPSREPIITIEHDAENFQTRVCVAEHEGRFYWGDVLRGLARARGWEDGELAELLPAGSVAADGLKTRAAIYALDRAARPQIRFRRLAAEGEAKPCALEITLDEAAMLSTQRKFKKELREMLTPQRACRDYGLHSAENLEKLPRDTRVVLVAHGWNSAGQRLDPLCEVLKKAGHVTAHFDYPNDQPIADSAALLANELKRVADERPDLRFAIVGHSMGGLVARAAIENADLDPDNVDRLIMVATPNHGSQLARIAYAFDLWQYATDLGERGPIESFFASIEDGLAEASRDLRPDSIFLTTLNRRERNPKVRYSLILGDKAVFTPEKWAAARKSAASAASKHRFTRIFGPKLDGILAEMDEVVHGRGDGAVSIARGRLAGVEDVVTLPFLHTDLTDGRERAQSSGLYEAIAERLT
jgi:pimeloyl-ACP methyl ester carboxylesterase